MKRNSNGYAEDIINIVRGLCMGAADIIPGVSGGTVALILGHYERLVGAIANIDSQFLSLLVSGQIADGLRRIDFRFLLALVSGIGCGIIALASLVHYLLTHQQAYIYATFTGMILASGYLVGSRIERWTAPLWISLGLGAALAWQVCLLTPMHGNLNPATAFGAATVAICAMILPGISGAFVLLLLGLYHPITELLRGLPKGEFTLFGLATIAAFCAGCLVGLLAFSRILRWLLVRHHDSTMAFLVGLMLGSLYKIWPFQRVTSETAQLPFKEQQFEWVAPWNSSANVLAVSFLVLLGAICTLAMENFGRRLRPLDPTVPDEA